MLLENDKGANYNRNRLQLDAHITSPYLHYLKLFHYFFISTYAFRY